MTGQNPAYAEKDRAYAAVWQVSGFKPMEVKAEWAGNNPRSGFIGTERQIRLNREERVMYPHRINWHSDPINAGPVYLNHDPEPTSPEILERLASRDSRKWYPVPYTPYVGWLAQRSQKSVGINV